MRSRAGEMVVGAVPSWNVLGFVKHKDSSEVSNTNAWEIDEGKEERKRDSLNFYGGVH
jgi:hypothetical protein